MAASSSHTFSWGPYLTQWQVFPKMAIHYNNSPQHTVLQSGPLSLLHQEVEPMTPPLDSRWAYDCFNQETTTKVTAFDI